MRGVKFALIAFVACASWWGCVGDDPETSGTPDGGAPAGEEGGPCFESLTCKTGLVCVLPNTCARPEAGAADATTDTNGGDDASTEAGLPCIDDALAFWPGDTGADVFGAFNVAATGGGHHEAGMVMNGFYAAPGYFRTTASTTAFGGMANFTIEFWTKFAKDTVNSQTVLHYGALGNVSWAVNINPSAPEDLVFNVNNVGSVVAKVPTDGSFHHVAFVMANATSLRSYLDGALDGTSNVTAQLPAGQSGYNLTIGANAQGIIAFAGVIDELAIYKVALQENVFKATFDAKSKGRCRTQ